MGLPSSRDPPVFQHVVLSTLFHCQPDGVDVVRRMAVGVLTLAGCWCCDKSWLEAFDGQCPGAIGRLTLRWDIWRHSTVDS